MAATGARMAKSRSSAPGKTTMESESKDQAVVRRMAELMAQKDWILVQAGRTLHDDLGQVLTAAGIQFDLLAHEAEQKYPELAERLAELQKLLEECQARTRVISQQMNRSTVDRVGLRSALERVRDRWEPGFAGFVSLVCPASLRPSPGAARAITALMDHAMELACNRLTCTLVEIQVSDRKGRGGAEASVYLENVEDPFASLDEEVRWHAVRGSCRLAGGDAAIELATGGRNGTILKAHFA